MDPNQVFAYMFSGLGPYIAPVYQPQWGMPQIEPAQPTIKPTVLPKKYHRTWKKNQVEEVFSFTTRYCQNNSKTVEALTLRDFEVIAQNFVQTPEQIMVKVNEISKSGTLRPGIWSQTEDDLLISVLRKGIEKWGQIANLLNKEIHKGLKIRTGKQCKERWNNYINPEINRGPWRKEEDILALEKYKIHGNKWSVISKCINNRTESAVKNRIKSLLNKIKQDLSTIEDISVKLQ